MEPDQTVRDSTETEVDKDETEVNEDDPGIILNLSTDIEIHQCLALPGVPAGLVQGTYL
jgi:hypothetical protein